MSAAAPEFGGFVPGGPAVSLPMQLFAELAPAIADEAELRATLHALFLLARRGWSKPLPQAELEAHAALAASVGGADALAAALERAAERGSLLRCVLPDGSAAWLAANEAGRRAAARLRAAAAAAGYAQPAERASPPSPAAVYEQEIGPLTPAAADALAAARRRWTDEEIAGALREAALRNARSWAYAEAILRGREREEGRANAAPGHGRYADVVRS